VGWVGVYVEMASYVLGCVYIILYALVNCGVSDTPGASNLCIPFAEFYIDHAYCLTGLIYDV
jgi:hypothetical protein